MSRPRNMHCPCGVALTTFNRHWQWTGHCETCGQAAVLDATRRYRARLRGVPVRVGPPLSRSEAGRLGAQARLAGARP